MRTHSERRPLLQCMVAEGKQMRYMRKFATVITGLLAVLAVVTAQTQEAELPGTERTILNRADLEGAQNMEVISSLLVVQPGAAIPAHFHNGIESGRVLEGGLIQMPGKEPQRLETGSPIFNLRGVMHGGWTSVSDKPILLYTVHIIDKAKPLFDGMK
jgi:quercetin dioxygenase-like cupin family protein